MSKNVRLYEPNLEEIAAPYCEENNQLQTLDPVLRDEILSYREKYLPHIRGNGNLTNLRTKKGGDCTVAVYQPADAEQFIKKDYLNADADQKLPGYLYSISHMTFLIDRKVARVLGKTSAGPRLQAASHQFRQIITSLLPGKIITSTPSTPSIPDSHLKKLVRAIIAMHEGGIALDPNPNTVLYDSSEGFAFTNALPTPKLITPPSETEMEIAKIRIDLINQDLPRAKKLKLKPTVEDQSAENDILIAARFLAYTRLSDFAPAVTRKNSGEYGHDQVQFQLVFLDSLCQLLGIIKTEFPEHFAGSYSVARYFLDGMEYTVESSIIDDPEVVAKISEIKALCA